MKKAALILVSLLAIASVPAFSQAPVAGNISLGIGAEGALPMGDLSNGVNFGIGGIGMIAYSIDPNLSLTGKIGYQTFSAKAGGGSLNVVPILVGARYFLMPAIETTSMRSYISADAGIYAMSASGGGASSTKFGIAPALGAQFAAGTNMNVDLHVNYTVVFSDPSSSSWLGIGVGLEFGM